MNFLDLKLPPSQEYSSDSEPIPLEFYLEVLPCTKTIYLKLGYFSSKAIQVLAYGFAQFIYNGGIIKMATNHFLYKSDKELLDQQKQLGEDAEFKNNLKWLYESLEGTNHHLINCLKYLVKHERLEIIPVTLKPNRMSHYKKGVFIDESNNCIYMDGSCNFTGNGLLENGENLSIYRSWGDKFEADKVRRNLSEIKRIIQKKNDKYKYLSKDNILDAIDSIGEDKSIKELLNDELDVLTNDRYRERINKVLVKHQLSLEKKIKTVELEPKFPFNSIPRDYQDQAYQNWRKENKQGIFAMATGTGKTITSLNCLLNEYIETKCYQAIILVPSKALLEQWNEEVGKFNFQNIILVSSKYKWRPEISELNTSLLFNKKKSFVVIATYSTFTTKDFQLKTKSFPFETLLIADEAHNMGRNDVKRLLPDIQYSKRIALSATPKRNYDPESNEILEDFFNSTEPYTFSYSMEKAIRREILCKYDYFPHIVSLNDDEMNEYREISQQLVKFFDNEKDGFKKNPALEKLLLKRKRIIHKAENKLSAFGNIIDKQIKSNGNLKYSFVYAPEGSDSEGVNMLEKYMALLNSTHPSVRAFPYTSTSSNNLEVMSNFEDGFIDSLFSMKCLDEGIDVPRAELAIFCSSTGNPRQFIQRRGRVLRKHPDKDFATIHDLVVIPKKETVFETSNLEKNFIKGELTRVIYFATLSNNYYEAMEVCAPIAEEYDVDIYALEDELKVGDH